jgi:Ca-activated chloride channel homolog
MDAVWPRTGGAQEDAVAAGPVAAAEGVVSFLHPWVLLLAALPLAWLAREWGHSRQRGSLVLKVLSLVAALAALAEPELSVFESKLAVAVLADTSASISDSDLGRLSSLITSLEKARGRHVVQVIPFARNTRQPDPSELQHGWHLRRTAGEGGKATDFEVAIREAAASLPAGLLPRIVLISDGRETRGSITRAAWQARSLGIPIDTYALAGRPEPKLRLASVQFPPVAFTGERFPIEISLESPSRTGGTVELHAEGKSLGSSPVTLEAGVNQVRVNSSIGAAGAIDLAGVIRTEAFGELRFEQAINVRRPRLLYLSQDPPGMEGHLAGALTAARFEVIANMDFAKARFEDYQIVLLNNWDIEAIPPARKADLESYVRQGGGLLVIGGEHNQYVEKKPGTEDALDRTLPATIAPPRSPEGTCVILIIDKSSSMEGRKMELARLAAIGVVENLRPIDQVGVLIFDNSFQWAVPLRRATDRTLIKRLVAGITPDGGTQIAPALTEAYKRALPALGVYKHIVLLTDGISEEGDSMSLAREAALQKITISTVGLGQDVNRAYLEKIAGFAKGKAYFLTDPSGLEQILLKDVMEHTGSTTVEKPIQARAVKKVELLDGVPIDSAPPLKGYVRFLAKPTADTILVLDKDDPLFTRWQFGLGRAAVFASDAKSRWAEGWVGWSGFDRFWENVLRDLLPHSQASETNLTYDRANGELLVDYRLARHLPAPDKIPPIFALGADGFQSPVEVSKAGEGAWRGRVHIGDRQGLFRVRPLADSAVFPEVGLYRPEAEMASYGSNDGLLKQIAGYTGGLFEPSPPQVFRPDKQRLPSRMRLWPGLLAASVILNLAELIRRKGATVVAAVQEAIARRRALPA